MTVRPGGRLDAMTSSVLEKELQQHLDGIQTIVMDFTSVKYISSGGLRMLVAIEQQLEEQGGSLKIVHANSNVLEVFDLVGIADIVDVVQE